MERVARDVESFHLGVGDLDALLAGVCIECALDAQSGRGCCRRDQFDDRQYVGERSASPRLRDVGQNNRCSNLFHFEVPGG
jgi:hypothetical protein